MAARKTPAPAAPTPETAAPTHVVETATSVRTGEVVTTTRPGAEAAHIEALRRERAGYAAYGRKDRVADVDAELERLGVQPGAD